MSNIVKINNKYYDLGTKNDSFLQTAKELKILGIKNWYFMLEVKHPELGVQDIDPRSENLTAEQQGSIILECKQNIWFYFREVFAVPARGAPMPLQFYLHRGSCAMIWCYEHNIGFMAAFVRQVYKTTTVLGLCTYGFLFDLKNSTIPFMHIDGGKARSNAKEFREYVMTLPPYMNPFYEMKKPPGIDSIIYKEHKTSIKIIASAQNAVDAEDKLRGDTPYIAFIDEWEFIEHIDSTMSGAAPAIHSGREITKKLGTGRNCIMMISTPGNLETATGKAAQRMIDATQVWTEQYYDMTENDIECSFQLESEDGTMKPLTMVYMQYYHWQLRKGEEYLIENYNEFAKTGRFAEYRRGCLLERFRGSDSAIFRQEDIDYIVQHEKQPDYDIFILKKFHLYVYKHEIYDFDLTSDTPYFDINIPYLIGMDISYGGGSDNTAIIVVHPYTLQVVAELSSPYIGNNDLTELFLALCKLIPKGVFCPEANSPGKVLVDTIQTYGLEYRVYHDPQLDLSKNVIQKTDSPQVAMQKKANNKRYIGVTVNEKNRKEMFQMLIATVKDYRELIYSHYLIKDIQNLVVSKGKIQADTGEHDDMVMAYNHVLYVLNFGHDLTRFGIDKTKCTYNTARQAVHDYVEQQAQEVVDNVHLYDHFTYQDQVRNDMLSSAPPASLGFGADGYDDYGYRYSDYKEYGTHRDELANNVPLTNTSINRQNPYDTISSGVLKMFSDMNDY